MRRMPVARVLTLLGLALALGACDATPTAGPLPPLVQAPTVGAPAGPSVGGATTPSAQVQARIDAANAAYRLGNFQQALSEAQEGIKLDPRNAEIQYLAANAYNQLGGMSSDTASRNNLFQSAIAAYLKTIELNPRKDEAMTNLATVYYQLGQLDEAQKRAEQALTISPNDVTTHYVLGTVHLQRSTGTSGAATDAAAREFEAVIKLDPRFPAAYIGLSTVYLFRNDAANALTNAQKGVELLSGNADAFSLWALAQAQCKAADVANGSRTLTRILSMNVPDARFRAEVQKLQTTCK